MRHLPPFTWPCRWRKFRATKGQKETTMPNPLYDALFGRHIGQNTPFLILPDGRTITHDQFIRSAARYANAFSDKGLTVGDRVAVQVGKSPDALALYAACVQAGLVFLPLNPGYTARVCWFAILPMLPNSRRSLPPPVLR
jgi:acyl-CoA synthetase (AMP-forming)/AMP-acid ligase II